MGSDKANLAQRSSGDRKPLPGEGSACYNEALRRFRALLDRARSSRLREPTAVTLATVDTSGHPSVRTVLLKDMDERGFVFYTSLASRKAKHLAKNPRVALCFFWQPLMEQVLIEGSVEQVTDKEADVYWASRPRMSQLGAWVSDQSKRLDRRKTIDLRMAQYLVKFAGRKVPRPSYWSGFRVIPDRIEFWKRRLFRLHERVLYEKCGEQWTKCLLYP